MNGDGKKKSITIKSCDLTAFGRLWRP